MNDILKIMGIIVGLAMIIVPVIWFFVKHFFSDMGEDIKEIKDDTKKTLNILLDHERRISCLEGIEQGKKQVI
jgi:hypothetical protein